jgi:hypothetical protein
VGPRGPDSGVASGPGEKEAIYKAIRRLARVVESSWQEEVFLGVLHLDELTSAPLAWGLLAVAAQLEAAGQRADEEADGCKKRTLKGQLTGPAGLSRAAGMLKDMRTTPLTTLRTAENVYVTAPAAVDRVAAAAWEPIFNPADADPFTRITAYFRHVGTETQRGPEFPLPPWDVDEFLSMLNGALDRAAGLDAWAPKHWRRMHRSVAKWLLVLFGLLEDGCAWPMDMLQARAVFSSPSPPHLGRIRCPSGY